MREIVSSSPQFIKDTEKETITHKFSPSNLMSFENGLFSRAWSSLFVFSWLFNPPYCLPKMILIMLVWRIWYQIN